MNNAFLQPQMPARQEGFPSPPTHRGGAGVKHTGSLEGTRDPRTALAVGALQSLGLQREYPPFVSYALAPFSKQVSGESQPVPQAVGWSVCNSEFV